jgi:hypothetical protein
MIRALLFFLMAALSGGCAFSNVDVHPPAFDPKAKMDANAPRSSPGRGREIILVAPFDDARSEPDRCGMQKNGWNMDTADAVCSTPPGLWLADALASELARAGYRVLRGDNTPGPTTVIVRGSVRRLFLEPKDKVFVRSVEADFSASLVTTSPSGLHAERTFYVKGKDDDIASTEGTFQAAADDATHKLARAMTAALTELLDRYPDLGGSSAIARRTP